VIPNYTPVTKDYFVNVVELYFMICGCSQNERHYERKGVCIALHIKQEVQFVAEYNLLNNINSILDFYEL
jgi:hypothetical protein